MSQRTRRVDELLRQELGEILRRDVADPRIGFATVTDVETAPDLSHARVWISVIGQPEEREVALEGLRRAMPFIRRELGHRLRLRRIPELHVRLDDTAERGTRVLRLLSELETGGIPEDAEAPSESLPTPVPRVAREGDALEPPADAPMAEAPTARSGRRTPAGRGGPRGERRPRRR